MNVYIDMRLETLTKGSVSKCFTLQLSPYCFLHAVQCEAMFPRDSLEPFHMELFHLSTDGARASTGPVPFTSETLQAMCALQTH